MIDRIEGVPATLTPYEPKPAKSAERESRCSCGHAAHREQCRGLVVRYGRFVPQCPCPVRGVLA